MQILKIQMLQKEIIDRIVSEIKKYAMSNKMIFIKEKEHFVTHCILCYLFIKLIGNSIIPDAYGAISYCWK